MTLQELKTIVANISATNIRIGGFCEKYINLHDELQLKVDELHQEVQIVNTYFYDTNLPIFGVSETKARILTLPKAYDSYEVVLCGLENNTTLDVFVKRIKKTVRLDDPSNSQNAGLCLLGPVRHLPFCVTIIFADTRRLDMGDSNIRPNELLEPYVYKEFWTEEERENFIKSYADDIDESVGDRVIRH